jgi:hypothetical protein
MCESLLPVHFLPLLVSFLSWSRRCERFTPARKKKEERERREESSALRQVWNRVTSMPSSQNRELNSVAFAAALEEVPRTSS